MLAPTLRRHGGSGAFHDLEQGLLHAFAGHVAGDRRIVRFAADLVDFIDIHDAALSAFDVVIAGLQQFQDDILNVFTHVPCLGQRSGIGHGERHIQDPRQRLRQQGLAAAGGANQKDVGLGQFHFGTLAAVVQPLVMVVHRHRQHALGVKLPDHIIIEHLADFARGRDIAGFFHQRRLGFLADDVVAQLHAFIADEHSWPGDQLPDLMLALAAEAAVERAFAVAAAQLGHASPSSRRSACTGKYANVTASMTV